MMSKFYSVVAGVLSVASLGSVASAALTPIGLTGYSHDVVYEVGATGSGKGTFTNEASALMETGLNGQSNGLPVGGSLTSSVAGTTFQLSSYTSNNALLVGEGNNLPKFGTLTFAAPDKVAYNKIAVLGLSAGGGSDFSMVIFFTDGTNTGLVENEGNPNTRGTFDGQSLPDWFNNGGSSNNGSVAPATGDLRRVDSNNGNDNGFGVKLQQFTFDLTTKLTSQYGGGNFLTSTKAIDRIEFESTGGNGNNRSFLAISGETAIAPVPEPTTLGVMAVGGLLALRRRRASM